jgi:hypothetical protein
MVTFNIFSLNLMEKKITTKGEWVFLYSQAKRDVIMQTSTEGWVCKEKTDPYPLSLYFDI